MQRAAKRRMPKFAFDYLEGGIGTEACLMGSYAALDNIKLMPNYLPDETIQPRLETKLFGRQFPLPFAPSPIGLTGLMWPRALELIAPATTQFGIPLCLSTFATNSIEEIGAITKDLLWFQLYCAKASHIEDDLMDRAKQAGCQVLIVTVDIPTFTRRERDLANGLSVPPRFNLLTLSQAAMRPTWAIKTLAAGIPRFRSLLAYHPEASSLAASALFIKEETAGHVTPTKLARIRKRWSGKLIVKGILSERDALVCKDLGVDGIVVSNHGGRQLDAAPTVPSVLPGIRKAVGSDLPLIADGGIRSGLDIARLMACGADFVLTGRPFAYAVAAAGKAGVEHAILMLKEELEQTLAQIGCKHPKDLQNHLIG